MQNCNQGINIPTLQIDMCNGETKPASCIIDNLLYSELGLEINSNQQQINQAMYLAFVNFNTTVNSMQIQIDNLQTIIDNLP